MVAAVVVAAGSPAMGNPYKGSPVGDVTLAEVTAAKVQGSTRLTIALWQTAETVDEGSPEKPSSSNYQSCRSETSLKSPSANAETVVTAVRDSRADATVPAGLTATFYFSLFTKNRTQSYGSIPGCTR